MLGILDGAVTVFLYGACEMFLEQMWAEDLFFGSRSMDKAMQSMVFIY